MLILLEGPDGGGKTTLAKGPLGHLPYVHNGPLTETSPEGMFWGQLRNLLPPPGAVSAVVDRNWPSEMIYGELMGRERVFDPVADRMFQRVLLGQGGVVVICLPEINRCREVWRARADAGQELLTRDADFDQMYQFYRDWQARNHAISVPYDYAADEPVGVLAGIAVTRTRPCPPGVIGNQRASVLVVGEQTNLRAQPEWARGFPFVSPRRNSRAVTGWLGQMGLEEHQLCWVNALTPAGHPTPWSVLAELPNVVAILALGTVASNWSQTAIQMLPTRKIALCFAPHPAAWLRFRNQDPWPGLDYARVLTFAVENGWC